MELTEKEKKIACKIFLGRHSSFTLIAGYILLVFFTLAFLFLFLSTLLTNQFDIRRETSLAGIFLGLLLSAIFGAVNDFRLRGIIKKLHARIQQLEGKEKSQ